MPTAPVSCKQGNRGNSGDSSQCLYESTIFPQNPKTCFQLTKFLTSETTPTSKLPTEDKMSDRSPLICPKRGNRIPPKTGNLPSIPSARFTTPATLLSKTERVSATSSLLNSAPLATKSLASLLAVLERVRLLKPPPVLRMELERPDVALCILPKAPARISESSSVV